MTFKPLLAAPVDFSKLDYSNLWLSAKLDGIRAIVIDGVVMSRKLIPIPNQGVQYLFGRPELNGYDGELIVGDPCSPTVYNDTYRGTMKAAGTPDVRFFAFDHVADPNEDYHRRLLRLSRVHERIEIMTQHGVENEEQLLDLEQFYLNKGYEGVMLRAHTGPRSRYKYGRSTANECTLLKLKRFTDDEAVVVGFEEELANNNARTVDELGRTKRSSHQENKSGKARLGALVCKTGGGLQFNIGTGFTASDREQMWADREHLVGRIAKFKHFVIGQVGAPRFPVFLGWRSQIDMSAD